MKTSSKIALALLWVLPSLVAAADDVRRVLARSGAAYAALRTYRDTGTSSAGGDDDSVFATDFARPDRMRFAWTKTFWGNESRSVLVADGRRVTMSHGDFQGGASIRVEPSLAFGVAGATGVSPGAAHTIATLLLPHLWEDEDEPFGRSVLAMTSPRLDDETIETVRCRHLTGSSRRGDRIDVWIAIEDHLVRRVDTVLKGIVFREVHRAIRIDEAVPDALFVQARTAT